MSLNKETKPNNYIWYQWLECLSMVQETGVQSQVELYWLKKMVLDASLLNTQHYKVRIKGKWSDPVAPSSTLRLQ